MHVGVYVHIIMYRHFMTYIVRHSMRSAAHPNPAMALKRGGAIRLL